MKLRTYQAFSMAEALAAVKRDLGADAVILNTRTFKRGGLLGLGRKTIIEVTATPTRQATSAPPKARSASAAAASRAYGATTSTAQSQQSSEPSGDGVFVVTEQDRNRTRRLAQAMAARYERQAPDAAQGSPTDGVKSPTGVQQQPSSSHEVKLSPADGRNTPVQRFLLTNPDQPAGSNDTVAAIPSAQAMTRSAPDAMQDELAAIRTMVGQVLQRQSSAGAGGPTPSMPAKLFDMYLKLIAQDISEELADTVVNEVRDALSAVELEDEPAVRTAVLERLASHIPVAEDDQAYESPDERPMTIALVGPTGVGKTTTLAKLAATFKLRQHRKVGLITSDTYRIAAVDQLRTYANIIGLPLRVALTPAEMRQAVHALSDCDVILIDTAGRGQNDTARLEELEQFLKAAEPHEVHLVLSGTSNEKVLLREAEAFSAVGINRVVLTKLDEAVSFGMLVTVVRKVGKQLSFLTTGQEVPNHIEVGRADRLADLILGGEVHA